MCRLCHAGRGHRCGAVCCSCRIERSRDVSRYKASSAAHELVDVEAHDFVLITAALAIVLPAEPDMGRVEIEQPAVGVGDAMCIAREIGQDLFRTGEGFLA